MSGVATEYSWPESTDDVPENLLLEIYTHAGALTAEEAEALLSGVTNSNASGTSEHVRALQQMRDEGSSALQQLMCGAIADELYQRMRAKSLPKHIASNMPLGPSNMPDFNDLPDWL